MAVLISSLNNTKLMEGCKQQGSQSQQVGGSGWQTYAGMAELVDAQDLGSCVARRAGSTPVTRTRITVRAVICIIPFNIIICETEQH